MVENFVVGLDFGTLSARAVLVSALNGETYAETTYIYPHGVITGSLPSGHSIPDNYALADPSDYRAALIFCLQFVSERCRFFNGKIVGIGIDATTYTMVPCYKSGTSLGESDELKDDPMAYIKLWKHHGAVAQAKRIERLHKSTGGFPAVECYGKTVNCEWALPKLLETYEESPAVFSKAARFCDLGEWLAWILTDHPVNSLYSAGFKGMFTPDAGFPSEAVLNELSPGFGNAFYEKFAGKISDYLSPCGYLCEKTAALAGLPAGIPVATPMGDGSMPGVFFCINNPKSLAITVGTSIAMAFVSKKFIPMTGINGVVKDGIVPGYFSYDAGQPCAGDMLDWFVSNQVPHEEYVKAEEAGLCIHEYFSQTANTAPYNCQLTVLDWFNGNRSILNDMSLRGTVIGYSLGTRPSDIYCAMVQGIVCGMRVILEHLEKNGIEFEQLILCGGIAEKNDFVCQQYANILGKRILVCAQKNITALSSATLALIASGTAPDKAADTLCRRDYTVFEPDMEHRDKYNHIYERYFYYYNLLSKEFKEYNS